MPAHTPASPSAKERLDPIRVTPRRAMTIAPASRSGPHTVATGVDLAELEPQGGHLDVDADQRPRCAVCTHELEHHDPISARYCRATQAQALPRGCICPSIG